MQIAAGVLVLLAAILATQWWNKRPMANDLTTYLSGARALWSGENPYLVTDPAPFVYPLFVCVALWPLAQLPAWLAGVLWLAGSMAAMALTISLLARIAAGSQRQWKASIVVAAAIAFVPLTDVVQNNIVNGQINFLVLACCGLFAWYLHHRRPVASAIWLAAAIAIKLTPAVLLLMLARRLAWKTIVLTVAFTGLFVLLLPWAIAGAETFDYYRHYIGDFGAGRITGEAVVGAEQIPFSVAGALRRFGGFSSPLSATIIGLVVAAIVALGLDSGSKESGRPLALTVCLYLAGALLITPMSEIHHLAALLPALTLLTWEAIAGQTTTPARTGLVLVFGAALLAREVPGAALTAVAGTSVLLAIAVRRSARPPASA